MRPSASSLPLLAHCQWWAGEKVIGRSLDVSPEMAAGTATHAAIEAVLTGAELPELEPDAAAYYATWAAWNFEGMPGLKTRLDGPWQAEQAFAYDPLTDTGRSLGAVRGRAYPTPQTPSEIVGTVDALIVDARASAALIVDWKTGDDRARLTANAADNLQLRGYALMVSRALGIDNVDVAVVRIGSQGVTVTRHSYDALDLAPAAEELRELLAAVPTAQPQPGLHCRRCRAVAECPATVKAADTIAPRGPDGLTAPDPVPLEITTDNAAGLLVRLRAVQAACDQVESALRAFADANGGVDLGDGRRWKRVTTERQSIRLDGPEAVAALKALEAAGVAEAVESKLSTSRAAIERVLTQAGLKGKAKAEKAAAILSELAAVGAVRVAQVDSFKETDK